MNENAIKLLVVNITNLLPAILNKKYKTADAKRRAIMTLWNTEFGYCRYNQNDTYHKNIIRAYGNMLTKSICDDLSDEEIEKIIYMIISLVINYMEASDE